jgi:uroporphyrinogen-III synthase
VLTRESQDNAVLASDLSAAGLPVVEAPCLATQIVPWDGTLPGTGHTLRDFAFLVFTSRRSVAACATALPHIVASSIRLAAVGQATARSIEETFGRRPDLVSATPTGEALARDLAGLLRSPARVLLVRGDKSMGTFQGTLTGAGIGLVEIVAYRNVPPPVPPVVGPEPLLVVFASPSAVDRFLDANPGVASRMAAVAIGPTTAARLGEAGVARVRVAPGYDTASLLGTIETMISEGTS